MEEITTLIKKETESLLVKVGITTEVSVTEDEDGYKVGIDTEENALLIGKHGNTLSSLELVLSLMVAKKSGEFKRVLLEVGDYRAEREEYLKELANRMREEVASSGYEKTIRGLKAWERRLIHLMLQEDESVTTESRGEGRDRVLVILKK
jgi:spoIIIJ-associated protein